MTRRPGRAAAARQICVLAAIVTVAAAAACRAGSDGGPRLTVQWSSGPAAGADSVADLRLTDAASRPLSGARVQVSAFMSHPGMAPVPVAVEVHGDGVYRARVRFTMAGDWILRIQGTSPGGQAIDLDAEVPDVKPAG